jgi:hypothetical protein
VPVLGYFRNLPIIPNSILFFSTKEIETSPFILREMCNNIFKKLCETPSQEIPLPWRRDSL